MGNRSRAVLERSPQLERVERRVFLKQGLSLGALTMLSGCDVTDQDGVQQVLNTISRWNDRVQALLFNPNRLAPTYAEDRVVKDFRFNSYYGEDAIPRLDPAGFKLELAGRIADKTPWTLDRIGTLPQVSQITRHVCVEGWSMIGKWSGVPLRTFLEQVGADLTAKYVGFTCADGYYSSLDMPSALHPQTQLTLKFADQTLSPRLGYPLKVRVPTKLGFKNPKWITAMFVTDRYPGGFWEDRGYNWFSGS